MPAAYARTATQALTNITYRYVELLADLGLKEACERQPALTGGINTMDGRLTHRAVAEAHGMEFEPPFQARRRRRISFLDGDFHRSGSKK